MFEQNFFNNVWSQTLKPAQLSSVARDTRSVHQKHFQVAIIGGGVSGCSIAFDLACRGYQVVLLDKGDFGEATSAATSKLLHGGLRYLKNYDFGVVHESLVERTHLMRMFPHLGFPLKFILPLYKGRTPAFLLQAGLTLYDLLASGKDSAIFPDKRCANHYRLSAEEALALEPNIKSTDLLGAFVYYDSQNLYPNRMTLEFALSAQQLGAKILNYCLVDQINLANVGARATQAAHQLGFTDLESGQKYELSADLIINASGPWADDVFKLMHSKVPKALKRSKGIHVIVPRCLAQYHALTLETPDKKHFFILPWRDKTIFGTTDTEYLDSMEKLAVSDDEVSDLLKTVHENTGIKSTLNDVVFRYAGVRPLVDSGNSPTYKVSRRFEIIDHHKEENIARFITVLGGKYTTSRQLAETVGDEVDVKLGRSRAKTYTQGLLQIYAQGMVHSFEKFKADLLAEFAASSLPAWLVEDVAHLWGVQARNLLGDLITEQEKNPQDFKNEVDWYFNKIFLKHFIENELTLHLSDLLRRRHFWGDTHLPTREQVTQIAQRMGAFLHWDASQIAAEVHTYFASLQVPSLK